MNRASVASRKGAPRIAPIPISPVAALLVPRSKLPKIATSGIMVSGNAVPTAASTLPTAPAPRFSRSPMISTALVKRIAAPSIAARDTTNSIIVKDSPYDHWGRNVLDSYPLASLLHPEAENMYDLEKTLAAVASGELSPE